MPYESDKTFALGVLLAGVAVLLMKLLSAEAQGSTEKVEVGKFRLPTRFRGDLL